MSDELPSTGGITAEFEAAQSEVTAREEAGPVRPEGHPAAHSISRPDGPGSFEQVSRDALADAKQRSGKNWALEIAEAAKAHEDAAKAKEQEKDKGGNGR